jgi:hypothetical protein
MIITKRINEYGREVQFWNELEGDTYHVTGVDKSGRRFKKVYSNWVMADGINVYEGSKWLVRDGRRYLIARF